MTNVDLAANRMQFAYIRTPKGATGKSLHIATYNWKKKKSPNGLALPCNHFGSQDPESNGEILFSVGK